MEGLILILLKAFIIIYMAHWVRTKLIPRHRKPTKSRKITRGLLALITLVAGYFILFEWRMGNLVLVAAIAGLLILHGILKRLLLQAKDIQRIAKSR